MINVTYGIQAINNNQTNRGLPMSRTHRIYNTDSRFPKYSPTRTYNPFWYTHDNTKERRQSNQDFRYREKIYFKKYHETLIKNKDRGWRTW